MSEDTKEQAKQRFHRCEAELIAALNGLSRLPGREEEIVVLRRTLMQSRQACEELGVEVESIDESARKQRQIDEAYVRCYAKEQSQVTPLVPPLMRSRIARGVGCCFGIIPLLVWPTLVGLMGSFVCAVFAWSLTRVFLSEFFPTPPVRIARKACDAGVDVSDLWPKDSPEFKDYVRGYRFHEMRKVRRGEPTGWIKIR
jgi:hypothetical protein